MASMWRRAMLYLGLGPDDEYDDYEDERLDEHPPPSAVPRYAPPEPPEAPTGAVRPLPRERDRDLDSPPLAARARSGVVRPITPQPMSAKPYAVSPASFNEAQEVADKFMDGVPVIVNLQGAEKELSRRLVDFASGLCYGLRGQMERVTNQVYLLTPSNVQVSDEEKRRLQERST